MAKKLNKNQKNNDNEHDDDFFKLIGSLIKWLRINAGFPTPEAFANTINMSRSQYSAYEAGKNMTIGVLKNLFLEFNLPPEKWINLEKFKEQNESNTLIAEMKEARVEQLIEEVKKIDSVFLKNKSTVKDIQRYIDILIYCHIPRTRKEILENLLKMDDSTNTMKRVAGKLLDYQWLEMTDAGRKNNPKQSYIRTAEGKRIIILNKNKI